MGILDRIRGSRSSDRPLALDPVNRLEDRLRDVKIRGGEIEDFVAELRRSQVAILLEGESVPGPGQPFRPLLAVSSEGHPSLCIFTHPDRAVPMQRRNPAYQTLLQVTFPWIVQVAPPGIGLVVNPGWDVTIEQPPDGFAQMRRDLQIPPAQSA